ncbi:hypothetical protein GEMRC1_013139 [Eukaryota sp. GEM-RC1]
MFLVFDLGGGTFEITLVKAGTASHAVIDADHDANLDGSDFDELLLQYCLDSAAQRFGEEIRNNVQFVSSLRVKCECAKKELSSETRFRVQIQSGAFLIFIQSKF